MGQPDGRIDPVLCKLTARFTETAADDEIVITHLHSGRFLALSGTGAAAWRLIDGVRTKCQLIAALADTHAGDRDVIVNDVESFLTQLRLERLIAHD